MMIASRLLIAKFDVTMFTCQGSKCSLRRYCLNDTLYCSWHLHQHCNNGMVVSEPGRDSGKSHWCRITTKNNQVRNVYISYYSLHCDCTNSSHWTNIMCATQSREFDVKYSGLQIANSRNRYLPKYSYWPIIGVEITRVSKSLNPEMLTPNVTRSPVPKRKPTGAQKICMITECQSLAHSKQVPILVALVMNTRM